MWYHGVTCSAIYYTINQRDRESQTGISRWVKYLHTNFLASFTFSDSVVRLHKPNCNNCKKEEPQQNTADLKENETSLQSLSSICTIVVANAVVEVVSGESKLGKPSFGDEVS